MGEAARKGTIFIISAPSGAGKTTLIDRVKETFGDLYFPVTMTTRPRREGEKDGVDYYFVDRDAFMKRVESGDLVEWTTVYDRLYGVPRWELEKPLAEGRDVLFDVDTKGRETLVSLYDPTVSIFISPPSLEELRRRLEQRGANSPDDLARRLAEASAEMERADRFDYVVINNDLGAAFDELKTILLTERARRRGRVERS